MSGSPGPDGGKVIPADIGAERALLGLMLSRWAIAADTVEAIGPECFYRPGHAAVFEAISHLIDDGRAVDPVTVAGVLQEAGLLDRIGGPATLIELVAAGGLSTSAPDYIESLKTLAGRRRMLGAATEAVEAIYDGDVDRAISMLDRALDAGAGSGIESRAFEPVSLGELMRGEAEPPRFLTPWLYAGGLTVFQAEPAVGKSWLALWQAAQVMHAGGTVLYFDEEGGSELVSDRLRTLGIAPELVEERFKFFPHESRTWDTADVAALGAYVRRLIEDGHRVDLAVLDSLPDFLSAAGLDENSNGDVTTFVKTVGGVFRAHDCATLVLDHLTKPGNARSGAVTRSKYARGAGAKLAKADATIRIETLREFDRHTSGALSVWRTKDRRGGLSLPRLGSTPRVLDVKVTEGGLGMVISEVDDIEGSKIERNASMPTGAMESLSVWSATHLKNPQSQNTIYKAVPNTRKETLRIALENLVKFGYLKCERGPRNAKLYRFEALYRQTDVLSEPEFFEDGSPAEMF